MTRHLNFLIFHLTHVYLKCAMFVQNLNLPKTANMFGLKRPKTASIHVTYIPVLKTLSQ